MVTTRLSLAVAIMDIKRSLKQDVATTTIALKAVALPTVAKAMKLARVPQAHARTAAALQLVLHAARAIIATNLAHVPTLQATGADMLVADVANTRFH